MFGIGRNYVESEEYKDEYVVDKKEPLDDLREELARG